MGDSSSDSESDPEMKYTPPEFMEMSKDYNSLPHKSRKQYEQAYKLFMDWQNNKQTNAFTEEILLEYFEELASKLKSSSLWTHYSMLKSTLSVKHHVDMKSYTKVLLLLKRQSQGYSSKKSKTLTSNEIKTFINEAPDELYLLLKVALIFGIMGACRRQELYKLRIHDIHDQQTSLVVKIPDKRAKTIRKFTVTGAYYDLCKKYISLRPHTSTDYFFLHYYRGKCTNQNVGINKFGNMCKHIASYLKLPDSDLYTGLCFRRTSANLQNDAARDEWKSTTVTEDYSLQSKMFGVSNMLQSTDGYVEHSVQNRVVPVDPLQLPDNSFTNMSIQFSTSSSDNHTAVHQLNFTNCTGITINISNPTDKVSINYL